MSLPLGFGWNAFHEFLELLKLLLPDLQILYTHNPLAFDHLRFLVDIRVHEINILSSFPNELIRFDTHPVIGRPSIIDIGLGAVCGEPREANCKRWRVF